MALPSLIDCDKWKEDAYLDLEGSKPSFTVKSKKIRDKEYVSRGTVLRIKWEAVLLEESLNTRKGLSECLGWLEKSPCTTVL